MGYSLKDDGGGGDSLRIARHGACAADRRLPDLTRLVEGQPRQAGMEAAAVAVAEVADEVGLPDRIRQKSGIELGVVETRHGAAVQALGAGREHEVSALERR